MRWLIVYAIDERPPSYFKNQVVDIHPFKWLSNQNKKDTHKHVVLINFWELPKNMKVNVKGYVSIT